MTIAQRIKQDHKPGDRDYAAICKSLAVSVRMDGPDFKVFTFEDGSSITMYWS